MKYFLIFTFIISFPLISQQQEKLFYSADRFDTRQNDTFGVIREYFGNVDLLQGNVNIKSDYAVLYEQNKISKFRGNVRFYQNNLLLKTERATYNGNNKFTKTDTNLEIIDGQFYMKSDSGDYSGLSYLANFYNNVYLEDDSVIINSNYLKYNKSSKDSYAYGNVLIKGKESNSYLISDTVIYIKNEEISYSYGEPKFFQLEESQDTLKLNDTLSIICDTMIAKRKEGIEVYEFKGNVLIQRDEIIAKSNYAVYDKISDIFILTQNPVIWYQDMQLYGDSITVINENKKIKQIKSDNNAFSIFKEYEFNELLNQMSGNTITIDFDNGDITEIRAEGNSKSVYFSLNDNKAVDVHNFDARTIKIIFAEGEIDEIIYLENIKASAVPHKTAIRNIKNYYLPKFKWEKELPEKIKITYKSNYFEF